MVPVHPIVIVIIILAIGVFGYLSWRQDKKRREALRLWAQQRGWRLAPLKIKSMHRDYPALKVFQKGHSRFAKNIIKGELNGRPVMMMDYLLQLIYYDENYLNDYIQLQYLYSSIQLYFRQFRKQSHLLYKFLHIQYY